MIKVVCIGHDYTNDLYELLKLFFPSQEIIILLETEEISYNNDHDQHLLFSIIEHLENKVKAKAIIGDKNNEIAFCDEDIIINYNQSQIKKASKLIVKRTVFTALSKLIKIDLPWGILTGIRPTKIVHELMEKALEDYEILNILKDKYYINEDKAKLLLSVAKKEHPIIYPIRQNLVSLYISIPFCPTTCVYCSFPSNPLTKWQHLQKPYIDGLCKEIKEIAILLEKKGKNLQTIYIGGGTPSAVTIEDINQLFKQIKDSFQLAKLQEFTFEAGRPDTITREKLKLLKSNGVTRISINPQTMNESTLIKIGRKHTVEELKKAFYMAKEEGFNNINMDIIIGLPGEDAKMVEKTMEEIKKLQPSSLTVHTLAIKRGSKLREDTSSYTLLQKETSNMLRITGKYAEDMGMTPYYLYRQKHMLGNLENIGYCKEGYECIYNVQIMEEKQTIIALGAGAVSKITFPKENRLERVPNVKDLQQYIARVDEMIERKKPYI
ncbi:coproporphyrinogen dehydrogenase HemZ [Alkaliphilus pronyensis]|uniref:Coproporphyrinogen dehydrogenase HemZ n=1 Tax=Alkaliphilus pronyensis TaxID=1482732 RepID=A0A6I0FA47_9FIRM|nr:coproporphyrinogen dehydrogenase HemZ [Alkaliphilus pronyensis]KAB3537282.1 coproporphyrinogen dehydrogenase HemZ [Alkaliphilus pronyensis]